MVKKHFFSLAFSLQFLWSLAWLRAPLSFRRFARKRTRGCALKKEGTAHVGEYEKWTCYIVILSLALAETLLWKENGNDVLKCPSRHSKWICLKPEPVPQINLVDHEKEMHVTKSSFAPIRTLCCWFWIVLLLFACSFIHHHSHTSVTIFSRESACRFLNMVLLYFRTTKENKTLTFIAKEKERKGIKEGKNVEKLPMFSLRSNITFVRSIKKPRSR